MGLARRKRAGFRPVPHTADVGFKVWGNSAADIFIQGAQALYSLMTDRRRLRRRQAEAVELEAPDLEALFVEWLNYLLYLFDVQGFLGKEIIIGELTATGLKARIEGEELDLQRHLLKTGVKAATYHQLAIRRRDDGWEARIIFDL